MVQVVDVFQLQCAAARSSLQQVRNRLKGRDLHTELVLNLSHTAHVR